MTNAPRKEEIEANLLAIVENADSFIYSLDRDFRYITINSIMRQRLKEVFGIDVKVGDSCYDFLEAIDPEASRDWKITYDRALKGENLKFVKEFRYSGTQVFWRFSINPIWQNGEVTGLGCFCNDVTELRQTRIALEKSENKYRLMFNNNPLPSWIYNVDTMRFIEVNDAAVSHYGYSREEFLSMTIKDIRPERDRQKLMEIIEKRGYLEKAYRIEVQHTKKNGDIIDVSIMTCPVEIEGKINVIVLAEDITGKKMAAAMLRESEERYRLVSENPLLGVGWASLTGDILYLNQTFCDMLGYTVEELKRVHYTEITHPDDLLIEAPLFDAVLKGITDHYKMEKRYIRKDGVHIWAELNLTRVKNNTGEEYCLGIIQDISQRKMAEEAILRLNEELEDQVHNRTAQLKAAYAEMEAFSYSVSHDLRSPLRLINGFVRILQNETDDRLKLEEKQYLEIIAEKVVKMDTLIRDMLKLSSVDKAELVKDQVDMSLMVANVLEELKHTSGGYHADISVMELPGAAGDNNMIKQVWTNLIGNAIKYSGKMTEPEIQIGVTRINDETVYYVRDNGAGFDMKYVHKLFNAFQRLHNNEDFEGTGVGLALVSRIISKHGGRIWAESKVNEGATFYFSLS